MQKLPNGSTAIGVGLTCLSVFFVVGACTGAGDSDGKSTTQLRSLSSSSHVKNSTARKKGASETSDVFGAGPQPAPLVRPATPLRASSRKRVASVGSTTEDYHVRVTFRLGANGVALEAATKVAGQTLPTPNLEGTIVLTVSKDGVPVYVGTAPDPRARLSHSLDSQLPPLALPGGSGVVGISIPSSIASQLGSAYRFDVYSASPALPRSTNLSLGSIPVVLDGATALGSASGTDVAQALLASTNRGQPASPHSATNLLTSGAIGSKKNLVFVGDGFAAADQSTFNTVVDRLVRDSFRDGPMAQNMNAFNIVRINAVSTDSGVTQIDSTKKVTTARNTALDYRYSGVWAHCWLIDGPNTRANLANILSQFAPAYNFVVVVLNESGMGGCGGGGWVGMTSGNLSTAWTILAHEFGHAIGDLGDEYLPGGLHKTFNLPEPGNVNLTKESTYARIKWNEYINPSTPLPTIINSTMHDVLTIGAFEGAMTPDPNNGGAFQGWDKGVFRPSNSSRMRSNSPNFDAVGYERMATVLDAYAGNDYESAYPGDFDGDGKTDIVVHNPGSLQVYRSTGTELEFAVGHTLPIEGFGSFSVNDELYVADFDGDSRDDLYVVNRYDFAVPRVSMLRSTGTGFEATSAYAGSLPGWDALSAGDQFFVADFDGDQRKDLYIYNFGDWGDAGYLLMLRSDGTSLKYVNRYDESLPAWDAMRGGDQFFVGRVNGDAKDDLFVYNYGDWGTSGYLLALTSNGTSLSAYSRADDELAPGWGLMAGDDRFMVANVDSDPEDELFVYNPSDHTTPYLGIVDQVSGQYRVAERWSSVLGWGTLSPNERIVVADINADGRKDLYILNTSEYSNGKIGGLLSDGTRHLLGWFQDGPIGAVELGVGDRLIPAAYAGGTREHLVITGRVKPSGTSDTKRTALFLPASRRRWLSTLRSEGNASLSSERVYPLWINNVEYHSKGWW